MTKRVLIIDGGCQYHGNGGTLNHAYANKAKKIFESLGWEASITQVDKPWDAAAEAQKVKAADLVILQTPAWWMAPPWQVKRYEDEVFCQPVIAPNDGRTHTDPEHNYGTGGTLQGGYMISCTWNAPKTAFIDPKEFFEGKGIDAEMIAVHKTFQFLGLKKAAPTFMANDVIKNPTFDEDMARFEKLLREHFA